MKYKRKDIESLKNKLRKIKKNTERSDDEDDDITPDVLMRHNDTGTLYKSHLLKTAQARGTRKNSYEKMIDKLNKKGEKKC